MSFANWDHHDEEEIIKLNAKFVAGELDATPYSCARSDQESIPLEC